MAMITKYKFNFQKKFLVPLWTIVAICIIGIITDCVFLSIAVKNQLPYAFYISSLALLSLLCLVCFIILFGTNYVLKEKHFICYFALTRSKIEYSDIKLIRHDFKTKQTIVYYSIYKKGEEDISFKFIFIKPTEVEKFVADLKAKNNMIIYEIFNKEDEDEQL